MKIKILIVNNENISVRNHRMGLIKTLINGGYVVNVASSVIDDDTKSISEVCDFHQLKELKIHSKNPIHDIKFFFELKKLYGKVKPDIILHFTAKPNIFGSLAANKLGIRSIATINGLGRVFESENLLTLIVEKLYKVALSKTQRVFFQNNDDKNLFVQKNLISNEKCEVLYGSGIDTDKIKSTNSKAWNAKKKTFIMGTRLIWSKGVEEYVRAAEIVKKSFPEVEFKVFGYLGKHDKEAVSLEYLNDNQSKGFISYFGPSNKMLVEIDESDIVVLPSYYREGIPKVLIEALALGKPIITTNSVGCKETVDSEKNGYLVKAKDSVDLASAMTQMLNKNELQFKEMGILSREKAVNFFDLKEIVKKYQIEIDKI